MIPKFYAGRGRANGYEWSDKQGAQRLANLIKKRWKDCGYVVHTRVELAMKYNETKNDNRPIYSVKTDLINGLPKGYTDVVH